MSPEDVHQKLVSLQEENEKLKKTSVSMDEVERLIEENRKMKMEIYKLQVSQYAHNDNDNDSKSDVSFNSNFKSYQQTSTDDPPKLRHPSSGVDLPAMEVHAEQSRMRSPGSSGNLTDKRHYDPT